MVRVSIKFRFHILTAPSINITVFWDVTPINGIMSRKTIGLEHFIRLII